MWWKNRRPADFAWSEKLSVGNVILDSEHRNLIAKINNIMHLIEAGDSATLSDAFDLLEIWLITHFGNEKMFAQALDIDFDQHELAHQRLLNEFQYLQDELLISRLKESSSKSKSYYRLLHNWLIEHIVKEDMQMKPALLSCQYGHVPSGKNSMVANIDQ